MISVDWQIRQRTGLPSLSATGNSDVTSLVVSGSDVYAGGWSTNSSGAQVADDWKDGVWTALSPLSATGNSSVNSLSESFRLV
jgi:hypothetical protein